VRAGATVSRVGRIVHPRLAGALTADYESSRVAWADELGGALRVEVDRTRGNLAIGCGGNDRHWEVEPIHEGHIIIVKISVTLKRPLGHCNRSLSSAVDGTALDPAVAPAIEAGTWRSILA